jgi:ribonucleoside-diphosphate reductase beta chain
MSLAQYDFKKPTNYLKRRMFLDPEGPVTVQRFEEFKHPKLSAMETTARGFFWQPEEINLTKDAADFKEASDAVKHIFTSNLLRQTALDSLQGRAPTQIFLPVVSLPELEALVLTWGFFESCIHSRSYSHIIRNIYNVPKDEFNKIHDNEAIINMASSVGKYYDALYIMNCKKEIASTLTHKPGIPADVVVSEYEHKKAIWLAMHASYALEALRFMVSFATSLAMVENRIFMGNGNIISLILQDELLHTEWTAYILNNMVKEDPDYVTIKEETKDEVYALYLDVIREEKEWADYLFMKGPVIGLNANILRDFVDYMAFTKLKEVGVKYLEPAPKTTPIPWFNKHVSTDKKQTALQESESTSYVIGVMTSEVNYDDLPEI